MSKATCEHFKECDYQEWQGSQEGIYYVGVLRCSQCGNIVINPKLIKYEDDGLCSISPFLPSPPETDPSRDQ